jgi:hypothetical protein
MQDTDLHLAAHHTHAHHHSARPNHPAAHTSLSRKTQTATPMQRIITPFAAAQPHPQPLIGPLPSASPCPSQSWLQPRDRGGTGPLTAAHPTTSSRGLSPHGAGACGITGAANERARTGRPRVRIGDDPGLFSLFTSPAFQWDARSPVSVCFKCRVK